MALSVKRNGDVTDGTTIVGRVESRPREGIMSALLGTEPTQREYRAIRNDGVDTGWRDTRKRALVLLERLLAPASATVTIERSYWAGKHFYKASVSWDGHYVGASSYAHEIAEDGTRLWVIDYMAPAGSIVPTFSNGAGSRVTRAYVLKPEQAKMCDDAVKAQGLELPADD